jgi:type IV secretion system protein VirB10
MKLHRSFLAANLIFSLVFVAFLTFAVQYTQAQTSNMALQRGYRTGYSDGYMDGYRDIINNAAKNYARHDEYAKADRAYIKDYGTLVDYRDGYQQGFEIGYDAGFGKSGFNATLPANLAPRGVVAVNQVTQPEKVETVLKPVENETQAIIEPVKKELPPEIVAPTVNVPDVKNTDEITYEAKVADDVVVDKIGVNKTNGTITTATGTDITSKINYEYPKNIPTDIIVIPVDTELVIELLDEISTDTSREGDKFTARIVSPNEIGGAIIEGRVAKMEKPGRIKKRAEILLSFDRIVLTDQRWSNFNAIVTDVFPSKGDHVKRVDEEGIVEGKRPYKSDAIKIGASTGTGLIVGAIVAGPVGAGVGAAVGAAFGVGAVVIDRGEHINLRPNQQLRIKASYETQIR